MSLEISPEQVLAGQTGQTAPQATTAPDAASQAPQIGTPNYTPAPGQNFLSSLTANLPPPPKPGGISESPQDQLRRQAAQNADSLIKNASDPGAPGAWARALVGGMQSALAGVGNIGKVPAGGGALYGVGKVMEAQQAQQNLQRQQAAKEKQQAFENRMAMTREQRQEDAENAQRAAYQIQTQRSIREMDKQDQDAMYADAQRHMQSAKDNGATSLNEGLTDKELADVAKQHASPDDPNGVGWLQKQNVYQDGFKDVAGPNGEPQDRKDQYGNIVGGPQRQQTYSILTWGDPKTVDGQFSSDLKKYLHKDIGEGTILKPQDARTYETQIDHAKAQEIAGKKTLIDSGLEDEQIAKIQQSDAYQQALPTWLHWLNDANGDPAQAMKNAEQHAQELDPKTGQPNPEAVKQYAQIVRGFGPDVVKSELETNQKKEAAAVTANAKAAAEGTKDQAQGDTKLSGTSYLQSIADPSERSLVTAIGQGQLPFNRMEYLLARNPRILQEVTLAYPDIDAAKFPAYIQASREFTTGSKIGNQLNSANTSLVHLKALYDANSLPGAFIGGDNYAKRQVALNDASTELARFLTGGTAPSKEDISSARASLDPSALRTLNPQTTKQEAVKDQVERINEKIQQYREQWAGAMPSSHWNRPMPGDSPDAAAATSYVLNNGQVQVPTPKTAPAFSVLAPDGKTQLSFPTQQALNQFKQAHGIQ